ncbi:MAG: 7-cyano-7-deazaguanine synthase QueC [Candidatus Omnitrophota bacterium]|nr:7-cyano-7-deazaguanine synthase QueC [Candidatus Omnitrophota bacterium]MBU2528009.1 7-cyano-7-deazaguanine synthase QueC [bacterium]MBU3930096.1 7-cyano-7-deazaguanine synthase QueC [bacterium]MBU4123709.1 7-cyano-7-deazaguanine synthase QueC [bacterium]
MKKRKAAVLLSGGLDSSTILYWAIKRGYETHCLIFSYDQRHSAEIRKAVNIAGCAGRPFTIVDIKLPWGGSSLLGRAGHIPPGKVSSKKIPSTYVPGRNTIFISYALSFCEAAKMDYIVIGANAVDFSGYPDCRPAYYDEFNKLLKQASLGKVSIKTPLLNKSKKEIVLLARRLKVPLRHTWSCYEGGRIPCGKCDSCLLRAKGFRQAGMEDPALCRNGAGQLKN